MAGAFQNNFISIATQFWINRLSCKMKKKSSITHWISPPFLSVNVALRNGLGENDAHMREEGERIVRSVLIKYKATWRQWGTTQAEAMRSQRPAPLRTYNICGKNPRCNLWLVVPALLPEQTILHPLIIHCLLNQIPASKTTKGNGSVILTHRPHRAPVTRG